MKKTNSTCIPAKVVSIPSNPGCISPKSSHEFKRRSGFGTVEIVLIIAVLISLALLFRTAITSYATGLITSVFGDQSVLTSSNEGDE